MKNDQAVNGSPARDQRRAWDRPQLIRLRAGEAELGTFPNQPDGQISLGS